MRLKQGLESSLAEIVNRISRFDKVVGVILFGSRARGEYDEFSDYDLIVLFPSREEMWKTWDSLFEETSRMKMNLHVIPQTIDELREANPAFLEELYAHSKLLYAKYPFEAFIRRLELKEYTIISYDMSRLKYNQKMRIEYKLFEKGTLKNLGGRRIGKGVIILPSSNDRFVRKMLEDEGAKVQKLTIFMED
jgi:predicted nucleotidyltransferase